MLTEVFTWSNMFMLRVLLILWQSSLQTTGTENKTQNTILTPLSTQGTPREHGLVNNVFLNYYKFKENGFKILTSKYFYLTITNGFILILDI